MYMLRRSPPIRFPRSAPHRLFSAPPPPPRRARHLIRTTLLLTSTLSLSALTLGLYTDAKTCPSPPLKLASASSATTATTHADSSRGTSPPLPTLLRTYFVYGLISIETVVDNAPEILDVLLKLPLVGTIVEVVVRRTFFDHFVGGDTAHGAYPLLSRLRSETKGVLLAYSVEADQDEATGFRPAMSGEPIHKRVVAEMVRSIDAAADFEDGFGAREATCRRTWVAVKLTALLPNARALRNLSLHLGRTRPALDPPVPFPGTPESSDLAFLDTGIPKDSPLTAEDVRDLKELYDDLNRICTRAKERSVRLILDAEYSWYQPAIDAFGHALMERFNHLPEDQGWMTRWMSGTKPAEGTEVQPLIYVTYQAYLRRTPTHLARSLAIARQNNYALGVKLVRGAYHPHELAAHPTAATSSKDCNPPGFISISPDPYPPVHPSKPDTDRCYNECAKVLVCAIADDLHSSGIHCCVAAVPAKTNVNTSGEHQGTVVIPPDVAERLPLDNSMACLTRSRITSSDALRVPCLALSKYVPYGALLEVMPYLSRRAIENKSVLGDGHAVRGEERGCEVDLEEVFGGVGL
ncbi:FAD-linked oxidoreductase [Melanogaster broomeanus]|nr:FAD-linked oxidoreductase [Melanogaster broomeanus]